MTDIEQRMREILDDTLIQAGYNSQDTAVPKLADNVWKVIALTAMLRVRKETIEEYKASVLAKLDSLVDCGCLEESVSGLRMAIESGAILHRGDTTVTDCSFHRLLGQGIYITGNGAVDLSGAVSTPIRALSSDEEAAGKGGIK